MTEGWQTAALAEKIPERVLKAGLYPIRQVLARESRGLKVEWEFSTRHNWLQVRARGEDSEAFCNLLLEKFGEAPVDRSRVERWDVFRGFVTGSGKVGFGVYVDLGVLEPSLKDALYPLHRMRAQLSDGVTKSCREILDDNAMVDYLPLKIIVTEIEGEKISVELADETRDLLLLWRRFPFDRVIAIGATKRQAEEAVQTANLQQDIIRVETLSLFAQSLLCKIGTDAPGIIPKIGKLLRGVTLAAYRTPVRFEEPIA